MKAYRIIYNNHKNGESSWGLQKMKKSWLTGKVYWVNYWSDCWECGWSRSINHSGTRFGSEADVTKILQEFIKNQGWDITKTTVVKEFQYEE